MPDSDGSDATDAKLRDERIRADDEIDERAKRLGETADDVIQRARERARAILALARDREDLALDRLGATPETQEQVTPNVGLRMQ